MEGEIRRLEDSCKELVVFIIKGRLWKKNN